MQKYLMTFLVIVRLKMKLMFHFRGVAGKRGLPLVIFAVIIISRESIVKTYVVGQWVGVCILKKKKKKKKKIYYLWKKRMMCLVPEVRQMVCCVKEITVFLGLAFLSVGHCWLVNYTSNCIMRPAYINLRQSMVEGVGKIEDGENLRALTFFLFFFATFF